MGYWKYLGYIALMGYIITVVLSAQITKKTSDRYNRALIIRYINSVMAIVWWIVPLSWRLYHLIKGNPVTFIADRTASLSLPNCTPVATPTPPIAIDDDTPYRTPVRLEYKTLSQSQSNMKETSSQPTPVQSPHSNHLISGPLRSLLRYALLSSITSTTGGLCWYASLSGTSLGTNTSLTKLRTMFTFLLSAIVLGEKVTVWKSMAVVFGFMGVICFAVEIQSSSDDDTSNTIWGGALALAAGMCWSVSDVTIRLNYDNVLSSHKMIGSVLYAGVEAIYAAILFWWVFWVQMPVKLPNSDVLTWIFLGGFSLIFCNVCLYIGLGLLSPFIMAVGGLLSIPLSFVVDILINNDSISVLAVIGAAFIICGFLMLKAIPEPRCCVAINNRCLQWLKCCPCKQCKDDLQSHKTHLERTNTIGSELEEIHSNLM